MAAARHECPDCETIFIGTPACPGCGWRPMYPLAREVLAMGPPPCTPEQNTAAHRVMLLRLSGQISGEEARQRLAEIFAEARSEARVPGDV